MRKILITVDVERDCPPMLKSLRGMEHGLPGLLNLFRKKGVKATFFVTAELAEEFSDLIERIVDEGHEIGCHGYAHERFDRLGRSEVIKVVSKATEILRAFYDDIVSFRAPNLKFPVEYLSILEASGYLIDSSTAVYKPPFRGGNIIVGGILRVPVSVTSSFLGLPLRIVLPVISRIEEPVLFVHPWEFVDMREEKVRIDCRLGTGKAALENLGNIIDFFNNNRYKFVTLRDMLNRISDMR